MSGSGICWDICKSAPRSIQITTSAPHQSDFYRLDALPAAQPTASMHWRHWLVRYVLYIGDIVDTWSNAKCLCWTVSWSVDRGCIALSDIRGLSRTEHQVLSWPPADIVITLTIRVIPQQFIQWSRICRIYPVIAVILIHISAFILYTLLYLSLHLYTA